MNDTPHPTFPLSFAFISLFKSNPKVLCVRERKRHTSIEDILCWGKEVRREETTSLSCLLPPEMSPFNPASCEHHSVALLRFVLFFLDILKYLSLLPENTEAEADGRKYQTTHQLSRKRISGALCLTESTVRMTPPSATSPGFSATQHSASVCTGEGLSQNAATGHT